MRSPDFSEMTVGFAIRRQEFGPHAHCTLRRSGDPCDAEAETLVVWKTWGFRRGPTLAGVDPSTVGE